MNCYEFMANVIPMLGLQAKEPHRAFEECLNEIVRNIPKAELYVRAHLFDEIPEPSKEEIDYYNLPPYEEEGTLIDLWLKKKFNS